jgi:hypothetical protein
MNLDDEIWFRFCEPKSTLITKFPNIFIVIFCGMDL